MELHQKRGNSGLIVPTADTRSPPDIGPNTHVIALLGVDEDDFDQKNNASPSLGDGWMVSDFYLWMHVLEGMLAFSSSQQLFLLAVTKP